MLFKFFNIGCAVHNKPNATGALNIQFGNVQTINSLDDIIDNQYPHKMIKNDVQEITDS